MRMQTEARQATRWLALAATMGAVLVISAQRASAAFVDFDAVADMSAFTETTRVSGAQYSQSSANGVGGAPGLLTQGNTGDNTNADNLFYTAQTYDYSDGVLTASIYFRAASASGNGNSRNFIGFAKDSAVNLATGTDKLGVRVFKSASSSDWTFQLLNGTSTTNVGAVFALTGGNWYQVTTTITKTANANEFIVAGDLRDYGATGTTLNGSFSRTGSATITHSTMTADHTWSLGLLGQLNNGGAEAFDNLSITVPEPGSLMALGAGAMILLRRKRR